MIHEPNDECYPSKLMTLDSRTLSTLFTNRIKSRFCKRVGCRSCSQLVMFVDMIMVMLTAVFSRAPGLLRGARMLTPESSTLKRMYKFPNEASEQGKTMADRTRPANDRFGCVVFNDTCAVQLPSVFFPADVVPHHRPVGTLADRRADQRHRGRCASRLVDALHRPERLRP